MSTTNDLEYHMRRNRQETLLAGQTLEPSARNAHRRLAELHRKKVGQALGAAIAESPAMELPAEKLASSRAL